MNEGVANVALFGGKKKTPKFQGKNEEAKNGSGTLGPKVERWEPKKAKKREAWASSGR